MACVFKIQSLSDDRIKLSKPNIQKRRLNYAIFPFYLPNFYFTIRRYDKNHSAHIQPEAR